MFYAQVTQALRRLRQAKPASQTARTAALGLIVLVAACSSEDGSGSPAGDGPDASGSGTWSPDASSMPDASSPDGSRPDNAHDATPDAGPAADGGPDGTAPTDGAPHDGASGADYVHGVWGDTSALTPPRALETPLVVTDLHRGRPDDGFTETGPEGQTIEGMWIDRPDTPEGRVWRVVIDGAGGDVWLNGNRAPDGTPRNLDHNVTITNCRTLRLSGLQARIEDIRTVAGGYPDCHDSPGWCGLVIIKEMPEDCFVFVEGCDIDLNEGGAYEMFRTDAFNSHSWGDLDNDQETLVIQNSRIMNVSSDYEDTHADIWHFQGGSGNYLRWFIVENLDDEPAQVVSAGSSSRIWTRRRSSRGFSRTTTIPPWLAAPCRPTRCTTATTASGSTASIRR